MHILAAFDKFKDSMSAQTACEVALSGVAKALSEPIELSHAPLTDGGEGFCSILTRVAAGKMETHTVSGPVGEKVEAPIGWIHLEDLSSAAQAILAKSSGRLAIIEMASVAGLEQVPKAERNPNNCSSYGVGELIKIASYEGASAILLGIGGSATSDLGIGALEALGLRFGKRSWSTPAKWSEIEFITGKIELEYPPILIACDVDNPLLGEQGAAYVYGPQKGLADHELAAFDLQAARLASMICKYFKQSQALKNSPGSGAAGGIGFGLKAALNAKFVTGFELVYTWLELGEKVAKADLVLTGEGKFDSSSLSGKGPFALASAAHAANKPCILLAGIVDSGAALKLGDQFPLCRSFSITPENCPLPKALAQAPENLQRATIHALLNRDR